MVFDGRPTPGEVDAAAAVGVSARFAPGGPNAADHAIVALLPSLGDARRDHRGDLGRGPRRRGAPGRRGGSRSASVPGPTSGTRCRALMPEPVPGPEAGAGAAR